MASNGGGGIELVPTEPLRNGPSVPEGGDMEGSSFGDHLRE